MELLCIGILAGLVGLAVVYALQSIQPLLLLNPAHLPVVSLGRTQATAARILEND
jgi:K+-transporting ATPase A subunit